MTESASASTAPTTPGSLSTESGLILAGVPVLDASALLAWLKEEPGADIVDDLLDGSGASVLNLSEVVTTVDREGGNGQESVDQLLVAGVEGIPVTYRVAMLAGRLSQYSRQVKKGLSLGDRTCLATASIIGGTAVTADHEWIKLAGLPYIPTMLVIRKHRDTEA